MKVYIGADHRGFELKGKLVSWLKEKGHDVVDCGNSVYDKDDDYPDYAKAVAGKVAESPEGGRGIVICGSGIGVSIAANKVKGIRSVVGINHDHVFHGRDSDDINILALAPDYISEDIMKEMIVAFLETPFSREDRHVRRKKKVEALEG
jgi:ribose 5-phosphate isomerase B